MGGEGGKAATQQIYEDIVILTINIKAGYKYPRASVGMRPAYIGTQMKENAMVEFDQELDASGLNCPLPVLRTKKALANMESGQVLKVIATDPGSVKDFEAFAKQTGNELLESHEEGGKYIFFLRKK